MILAAGSLSLRELVRFFRQPSRLVGALGTPAIFWVLVGSGFNYLAFLFPGTLVQILLFASIFSTISVIQDRQEGFLQGVLVAPVPRLAIVLGKVLGGTAIALLQGVAFLALAPAVGLVPSVWGFLGTVGIMALLSFGLTALGVLLAWRFDSVQGFHGVMNLLLIPMWLLSGAVFPQDKAAGWIRWVMWANPLTYGVSAVRRALTGEGPPWGLTLGVTAAFSGAMLVWATLMARSR